MPGGCSSPSPSPEPAAAAGAPAGTVGCNAGDGDAYSAGMKKTGAAAQLEFTLVSSTPAPPALHDNEFIVQVSDRDGTVLEGELSVTLDMPEHGHPSPTQPEIRFDAESRAFSLAPVNLFMVGLWRVTFSFQGTVDGAPRSDSAVFEFCID